MRLTLRTMLAYLDDILEPSDAQELGRKIDESEFASGLVHRIRNSIGRLRLSGPKMLGQGMGADPNTVAEYLDNTLPADRVPELEKVCLESDIHLAEVASCHQILTLVLGEPARVDQELRQRVYHLGSSTAAGRGPLDRVDQALAAVATAEASDGAPIETQQADLLQGKPVIPDYLRSESARHRWPLFAAALAGFILTVGVLYGFDAIYGLPRLPRLTRLFSGGADVNTPVTPADKENSGVSGETTGEPPVAVEPSGAKNGVPPDGATEVQDPVGDDARPAAADLPADAAIDETGADAGSGGASVIDPGPNAGRETEPNGNLPADPPPGVDNDVPSEIAASEDLAGPGHPNGVEPSKSASGNVDGSPPVRPREVDDRAESVPATDEAPGADIAGAEVPVEIGRFLSHDQVLAFWEDISESWFRLPERAPLVVGHRLRVLPAFRPQFLLSSGTQVTLAEGTDLLVDKPHDAQTPTFATRQARAVFVTVGQAGGRIALRCDSRDIVVTMDNASTEVVVEVSALLVPGHDPSDRGVPLVARIWVIDGRARVESPMDPAQAVNAGQQFVAVGKRPGKIIDGGSLPEWLDAGLISEIDRMAAGFVEPALVVNRTLALTLAELSEHRKVDVRSLSARCLCSLDEFVNIAELLSDVEQHSSWKSHYDELQVALARGAETAKSVEAAFQRVYGVNAPPLYRMLWGFSEAQLREGRAAALVDFLDHEAVEFRVLSFENLRRITGATSLYHPEHREARRRPSVSRWRDRLEKGEIVYLKRPPVLPVVPEGRAPDSN